MIYIQLISRAKVILGQPLSLGDAAKIIGPDDANDIPLACPEEEGV